MKKVRILSLDGGGIRGIIPATVMKYVESQLKKVTKNPNACIADYFDMVVGTSTGAILACYYMTPHPQKGEAGIPNNKYSAEKALEIYSKRGIEIFNQSKKTNWLYLRQMFDATKFSPKNIEKIFLEVFGDDLFENMLKPCIITTYDLVTQQPVFFNSHEEADKKSKRKFYVRDVVRSTSAAPTYFPPAEIVNLATNKEMVNIDGGVFANNPVLCAYAEARTTRFKAIDFPKAENMLILSIGTGSQPLDIKESNKSLNWGLINWAKHIPSIMMDGGLDTVNYQADKIFATIEDVNHRKNFKRVNVPKHLRGLDESNNRYSMYSPDMSDASPQNTHNLMLAGEEALKDANLEKENEFTLDQFIEELVKLGENNS